jgi:hypothetical protein
VSGLAFRTGRHIGPWRTAHPVRACPADKGSGTSLRDLMTRMGHDNPRAALIYQHASAEADVAIAAAINAMVEDCNRSGHRSRGADEGELG